MKVATWPGTTGYDRPGGFGDTDSHQLPLIQCSLKIAPMSLAETPTLDSWPDILSKPDLLSSFLDPSTNTLPLPVLEVLLIQHIKPIFDSNIHPNINPTTGRKLPRPAGGPLASQDFYDEQIWKEHPGIDNVIRWCLKHIDVSTSGIHSTDTDTPLMAGQRDQYEKIWHLLIPPIMTMLDDYEPKYKLGGVMIVQEMMNTVPGKLLRRTGVEGLIRSVCCISMIPSHPADRCLDPFPNYR